MRKINKQHALIALILGAILYHMYITKTNGPKPKGVQGS